MESTATAHGGHGDHASRFHTYIKVAMILAVITGIEIIIIYVPIPAWIVITALAVLSLVKFMYVIFYFMHLRWDKVFCTILFFIGLILAGGTAAALLALMGTEATQEPPAESAALSPAERAG